MALQLDHVFSSERMRAGEIEHDPFIHRFASRIEKRAVAYFAGDQNLAGKGDADLERTRARNPDDPYTALTRRGSDRRNGVDIERE